MVVGPDATTLNQIEALLRARQNAAAEHMARELTARSDCVEGHILLGRALQQQGRWDGALQAAAAARGREDRHPAAVLLLVECLLQTDEFEQGLRELQRLEREAQNHAGVLQDVGRLYSHLNLHVDAERCYARASSLCPRDPQALYNWATCLIAVGRLDAAEESLTRVIALAPDDFDAYYNRSTLRRQRPERNHVEEIQQALARHPRPDAQVALGFALAKELEDLQRHPESFAALKGAADTRRAGLSYQVADDTETMAAIAQAFAPDYFRSPVPGHQDERPIFIVGLPRSGTTLVDRILSSHRLVQSRGESSDVATSLMRLAGPVTDKGALIRRAAALPPAELGRSYCARLPDRTGAAHIIDKTPMNFLYLGLIAAALPSARIIHVRRRPMDVCYAMYKTLFRMAYPFSYDLSDLARYYAGYERLMRHWREMLGPRLIEIDYEQLVAAQEPTSRMLLDACALPWDESCLDFHNNRSPSLTASAAQVRKPLYGSSVALWRHYERELMPLLDALRAAGVPVE